MEQTFTPEEVKRHVERLDSRLSGVRRKVGTWFIADGIARVFVWAIVLFGLDLLIDWGFQMDKAQRGIMLALILSTLAVVAYRRIVKPLTTRLTNRAICHEVEKTHPELADRLTTAMELSRHEPGENISKPLTDAAIEDGFSASKDLEFNTLIRHGRFGANLAVSAVIVIGVVVAAVTATAGSPLSIWFNRNILLGDATWPQDFYLEIPGLVNNEMIIPRGDDWPIECVIKEGEEVFPEELWLELPSNEIRMEHQPKTRIFRAQMRKVLEPTTARIYGDGGSTPEFSIKLVDRPVVTEISLLAPRPSYVGGVEVLEEEKGPYYVLKGSTLEIRGESNKELSGASLIWQDESGTANYNLDVSGNTFEGKVGAGHFVPGTYTLVLLDKEKVRQPGMSHPTPLESRTNVQFSVREKLDTPPEVKLKLSGVSSMVVPKAYVPFSLRAKDDYETTSAKIEYQWVSTTAPEGTEPTKGEIKLPTPDELEPEEAEPEEGEEKAEKKPRDPRTYSLYSGMEIADLNIPEGSSLTLEGVAFDNDDVSGPNEGRSSKVLLRVVSESELRADLLRREIEDRQALEEITKLQDKVYTDTRSLQAAVRSAGEFSADHRKPLLDIQKSQKLLAANLSPVIGRLEQIIQEYQNNRIVGRDGENIKRLHDGAVVHLLTILENYMPDATLHLESVRRLSDDAEEREKAFTSAVETQTAILEKLNLVLQNLEKNEGFQRVINLLHDIAKEEGDVLKATEEAKKERLEGTTKKDPDTNESEESGEEGEKEGDE